MRLTVVGCSPAWQNPGGAQSGYLVEGEGRLLLDCGPGVLPRLRAAEGWPRVDAIAITHFHLDHWGDLVPWAFGTLYGPGRERGAARALAAAGRDRGAARGRSTLGTGAVLEMFAVREYTDAEPFRAAGFELTPVRMAHYDHSTYGFRVAGDGRTLAYSGDSAPGPQLTTLARDADLFLCEATLAEPEPAERGHLTAEEAVDVVPGLGRAPAARRAPAGRAAAAGRGRARLGRLHDGRLTRQAEGALAEQAVTSTDG